MIKLKVCCIQNIEEAQLAIQYGANLLGLVSEMPSGPGPISDEEIAEITPFIPPGVDPVLLTCKVTAEEVIQQQQFTGVNTIQLVDRTSLQFRRKIKETFPGVRILQVVHVTNEDAVKECKAAQHYSDGILLDSGNPEAKTKILGGTGNTHNWDISAEIVNTLNIPVFLAGGLNPRNIKMAVEKVKPYGIDLCSGLRTNGMLDEELLKHFTENLF